MSPLDLPDHTAPTASQLAAMRVAMQSLSDSMARLTKAIDGQREMIDHTLTRLNELDTQSRMSNFKIALIIGTATTLATILATILASAGPALMKAANLG